MPAHAYRPSLLGTALALSFACCATPAFADDTGESGTPGARFTGPLVSGSPALPAGLFNIEPYLIYNDVRGYYDGNGDRQSLDASGGWHLAVPMMYGLTQRISVGGTLNAFHGDNALGDGVSRMGDTQLSVMALLAKSTTPSQQSLTFVVRQNLPTGQHDRMDLEPHELTTGTGASTTRLALHGQRYDTVAGRTLRSRANLKWSLPEGATIHGASVYGTPAGFEGHADLDGGAEATIGLEYALDQRWVLAGDVVYERDFGGRVHGAVPSTQATFDAHLPNAWRASVAPAVEYHFNDNVGLIAGAFVSLAGRNSGAVVSPQVAVNVAF